MVKERRVFMRVDRVASQSRRLSLLVKPRPNLAHAVIKVTLAHNAAVVGAGILRVIA